jgi:Protein of unknown function (DUF3175)
MPGTKQSSKKKTPANATKKKSTNRWVAKVTTDSTHPPEGLFNQSAATIARSLASKKVSPKGPGSGMRMLTYYINRAGHNLSATRRAELEKAKALLSKRVAREKEKKSAA